MLKFLIINLKHVVGFDRIDEGKQSSEINYLPKKF
jgi:hypothetical protein